MRRLPASVPVRASSRGRRAAFAALTALTVLAPFVPIPTRTVEAQAADAEIWLLPLRWRGRVVEVGAPLDVSRFAGYDNQPAFSADGTALFWTRQMDGQTDIVRYDLRTGVVTAIATAPESEYSATPLGDDALAVVRVEADSAQRLWRLPLDGRAPSVLVPDVRPVGYFAFARPEVVAMFVLGRPATLQVATLGRAGTQTVARDVGRSIQRVPGREAVSYVQKGGDTWHLAIWDAAGGRGELRAAMPAGREDHVWLDSTRVLVGDGTRLLVRDLASADTAWRELADLAFAGLSNISRLAMHPRGQFLAIVAERPAPSVATPAVPAAGRGDEAPVTDRADGDRLAREVAILAADSMAGRATASEGGERAARWLAEAFRAAGLEPAGDDGTFRQRVPLRRAATSGPSPAAGGRGGTPPPRAVPSWAAWDSLPAAERLEASNIVGIIRGADEALAGEAIVLTAHYDHVGIGRAVDGDSIYNGADDDASGTIAMLQVARALVAGPRPKRTIVVVAVTGEEIGLIGTRWYLDHPAWPLERTVANVNFEMLGRPDPLLGAGRAWLSGFERSTLADLLGGEAVIGPDLRPANRFFERSDNIAFARLGIVAHTLSSYGLHADYHRPSDEARTIDGAHMARVATDATRLVRRVANEPSVPAWKPGGKP